MITPKTKTVCIYCKLRNCVIDFDKHPSRASFGAIDRWVGIIKSSSDSTERQAICADHMADPELTIKWFFGILDRFSKGVTFKVFRR